MVLREEMEHPLELIELFNQPRPEKREEVTIKNMKINDLIIREKNHLATAAYEMTLREKRLLALAMANVRFKDDDFVCYHIPVPVIKETLGLEGHHVHTEIQEIAKKLLSRIVEIKNERGRWKAFQWVSYCEYVPKEESKTGEAYFEIQLHDHLIPMLLRLEGFYTRIRLKQVLPMVSNYSVRMYEILTSLHMSFTRDEISISVADLRKMLGTSKKYKDFRDFRLKVLKPAQEECEKYSDLKFTWTEDRQGVKVVMLNFLVVPNPKYKEEQKLLPAASPKQSQPSGSSFQSAGEIAKNAINPQPAPASDFKPVFDNHLAAFSSYEKRKTLDIVKPVPNADKQAIIDEFNDALNPNKTKPVKQRWQYLRELVRAYEQGKFTSTSELSITREKKRREAEQAKQRVEQEREKERQRQLKEQFYEARHEKTLEIWADWSGEEQEQFLMLDNYVADRYRKDGVKSMMVLSMLAEYMAKNGDFPADLKSFEAWQEATETAALAPA